MNCVEMSSIFCRILGPLVFGWAPNHFILGAQLAPGEKMLVCIPAIVVVFKDRSRFMGYYKDVSNFCDCFGR